MWFVLKNSCNTAWFEHDFISHMLSCYVISTIGVDASTNNLHLIEWLAVMHAAFGNDQSTLPVYEQLLAMINFEGN